jgi:hypothetical protein
MKIVRSPAAPEFQPFQLTISVESSEQAASIAMIARANCRIPELFNPAELTANRVLRVDIRDFLNALNAALK